MISCLSICVVCVIMIIVMIAKLAKKDDTEVSAPTVSSSETVMADDSANLSTDTTSETSDASIAPESSTSTEQTVDAATRAANLEMLKSNITSYLDQQTGRFSVYYINMENGETLGINESTPIVAASCIKIAYNTYLYEKVEAGEISMSETMKYNASPYPDGDLEPGTGSIQNSANGTEYTIQQVSHLSITQSDNCGTNMIIRRLGGEDAINDNYLKTISSVVNYREKVSYTDFTGKAMEGKRRTSSIDLAKYAEHTYQDWTRNQVAFQPLIDDLCNTEYSWGIPKGLPADVKVAHKIGLYPAFGVNNDVAIVFASEDYVLAVMTESGDSDKAQNQIIGEVSRMVYEFVESNHV